MKMRRSFLFVFLFSFIWFSFLQPWGGFVDPDAFYHAKMAALILLHGPLQIFPWLDLTTLGAHFSDQHFLFHVLLIPFVKLFGMLPGTQIAAVVFASAFLTIFFLILRRLRVSYPWAWTMLAGISAPLAIRLSLGKASPLALAWFVLGLFAMATPRRRGLAFLAGFGFALSHGGWIILLAAQIFFLMGGWMLGGRLKVKGQRPEVLGDAMTVLMTCSGVILGLLGHPNARENLVFLWVQVVKVGLLGASGFVALGQEWSPIGVGALVGNLGPVLAAAGLVMWGLLSAPREPLDLMRARQSVGFGMVVALLVALTFKSQRMIEYLIPVFILWLATLGSLMDEKRLGHTLRRSHVLKNVRTFFCVVLGGTLIVHEASGAYHVLRTHLRRFDRLTVPLAVLRHAAQPGDRVFHDRWEDFPELFADDDRLRYVSGLDPTFLAEQNLSLARLSADLVAGRVTSTAYDLLHDRFGARFIFLERPGRIAFEQTLRSDARFQSWYQDDRFQVWRVF